MFRLFLDGWTILSGGVFILAGKPKNSLRELTLRWLNTGAVIIGFLILVSSFDSNSEIFSTLTWTVVSATIIFSAYQLDGLPCVWHNKMLIYIGNISFEIFLIHQLIIRYSSSVISHLGFDIKDWMYIAMLACSVFLSDTVHKITKEKGCTYNA